MSNNNKEFYANKTDRLEGIDKFPEMYNLPSPNQEETELHGLPRALLPGLFLPSPLVVRLGKSLHPQGLGLGQFREGWENLLNRMTKA